LVSDVWGNASVSIGWVIDVWGNASVLVGLVRDVRGHAYVSAVGEEEPVWLVTYGVMHLLQSF